MIQETYVSFETAKLLKEKGFDENTLMVYMSYGDLCKCNRYDSIRNSNYNDITKNYFECTAPTHQMAIAWLREKGIAIIPIISSILDNEKFLWNVNITIAKTGETYTQGWVYESYESIVDDTLKYTLENLI